MAGQKAFILVVEDSKAQAVFLAALLERANYEVVCVEQGAQALERLARRRPALIISDVVMPVMDGYELCRQVKAIDAYREIPFMLLTLLSSPQDVFKGLESGADYYCIKPYDETLLLEQVSAILAAVPVPVASDPRPSLEVVYAGRKYAINAGRSQILNLLLATFESAAKKNLELAEANQKLTEALEANKTLSGMLPICGYCKKIRDDKGYWDQVETFVAKHSAARFTHSICPECFEKAMGDLGPGPKTKKSRL